MSNQNRNTVALPEGAPPKSIAFTFRDTGEVVFVSKVSLFLAREITKNFPPPKPPLNKVMYGTEEVWEPNESDPEYIEAVRAHDEEVKLILMRLMIKRGVWVQWDDYKASQVASLRQDALDLKTELDPDDKLAWIMYIAAGTPEDMNELLTAITQRSQPTEGAIRENISNFRD